MVSIVPIRSDAAVFCECNDSAAFAGFGSDGRRWSGTVREDSAGASVAQVSAWGTVLLCLPLVLVICLRSSISKQGKELAFIGLVLLGAYATSKSYIDATNWLMTYTGNAACSWGAFIPAYVVTGLGTTLFSYLALTLEDEGEEL